MALAAIFMGTPAFSVPTLRAIAESGHDLRAVYSQPPRPSGRRGLATVPSPVAMEAARLGIEVRTPVSLKSAEEQASFARLEADVAVVVAYGLLLPQAILDAPRLGALNGHASLLPRWRGAAPIQRAIEMGDATTGMMVMLMEAGLDTGPVALVEEIAIGAEDTAGELHERLSQISARLMVEVLERLEAGTLRFEDQSSIATRTGRETVYAKKIEKSEAEIDFSCDAERVAARINAFSPAPGAWTRALLGGAEPERLKILRARAETGTGVPGQTLDERLLVACGTGAVRLLEVQRAGGRAGSAAALLNGTPIPAGRRLG